MLHIILLLVFGASGLLAAGLFGLLWHGNRCELFDQRASTIRSRAELADLQYRYHEALRRGYDLRQQVRRYEVHFRQN